MYNLNFFLCQVELKKKKACKKLGTCIVQIKYFCLDFFSLNRSSRRHFYYVVKIAVGKTNLPVFKMYLNLDPFLEGFIICSIIYLINKPGFLSLLIPMTMTISLIH